MKKKQSQQNEIMTFSKEMLGNMCLEQACANFVALGKFFHKSESALVKLLEKVWEIEDENTI